MICKYTSAVVLNGSCFKKPAAIVPPSSLLRYLGKKSTIQHQTTILRNDDLLPLRLDEYVTTDYAPTLA